MPVGNIPAGTNYIYPVPPRPNGPFGFFQRGRIAGTPSQVPLPARAGSSYELWPTPQGWDRLIARWRPADPSSYSDIPFPIQAVQTATKVQQRQAQFTQPQISRLYWRAQDPSNWEGTVLPLLTSTGPSGPPATPFSQDDWPTPKWLPQTFGWIEQGIVTITVDYPFNQFSWPLPIQVRSTPPFQPPNLVINQPQQAAVVTVQPFNQDIWPTPQVQSRPQGVVQQSLPILNTQPPAAPAAQPFTQTDWPSPKRASQSQITQPFNLATAQPQPPGVAGPQPFNQTDWPVPKQAKIQDQFVPGSRNVAIPAPPPVSTTQPFVQTDWPTPRNPFNVLQSWSTLNLISGPSGAFAQPFAQFNWPVPAGAIYPNSLRTWISSTIELLNPTPITPPVPIPFNQTNWPVPQRAVSSRQWDVPYNLAARNIPLTFGPPPPGQQWFVPPVRQLPRYTPQFVQTVFTGNMPPFVPPVLKNFEWLARARRRGRR